MGYYKGKGNSSSKLDGKEAELIEAYKSGATTRQLAKNLGISTSGLFHFLRVKKIDLREIAAIPPREINRNAAGQIVPKHGQSNTAHYAIWRGIIHRCDPNSPSMPDKRNYAGRGIKVCERWQGSDGYVNFIHDMGFRPSPKHSLDRINNDGDYELSNCRWATKREQSLNRRKMCAVENVSDNDLMKEVFRRFPEYKEVLEWPIPTRTEVREAESVLAI